MKVVKKTWVKLPTYTGELGMLCGIADVDVLYKGVESCLSLLFVKNDTPK